MIPATHRSLSTLQAWPENYNHNDIDAIARSIRRFGFNNALRVHADGIIMAGNHTFKALLLIKEEGANEALDRVWPPSNIIVEGDEWHVPVIDVSHLDPTEAKAFAIADNQLAKQAVTDDKLLAQYLQEIADTDKSMMLATGYDDKSFDRLLASIIEDIENPPDDPGADVDRAAELRKKWGTERGQLWIIPSKTAKGDHRLLCGDSTNADEVARLMNGKKAALFSTDPPYLVGYTGTGHPQKWGEADATKNKDWSDTYKDWDNGEDGAAFYEGFVTVALSQAIRKNAAWYCWHACWNQSILERAWEKSGAFVHQQIIWVKDRPVLTRSWYMWQHEPAFFGWVKGQKPRRLSDDFPKTVWEIPTIKPGTSTDHPTSKPVELFAIPMRQHTEPGDICYEPFSGSGSQHVAGEQNGRLVYGMEIAPEYVAVILERLSEMGLEPRLADSPDK